MNSLNRIKYYQTLFALKTQNCFDNFTRIIATLNNYRFLVWWFGSLSLFSFKLLFARKLLSMRTCVETSLLIFIAKQFFDFCTARDIIVGNFWAFCGFLNVTLFARLCFRLIELMSMVFFLYLTCCLITVQEFAKLFRFEDAS